MKKKFSIFLFIFFMSFKLSAGDDLSGKGLYCKAKDLIIYLDFNSPFNADVHYLQRYDAEYVTNSSGITEQRRIKQVQYRYKYREEKYSTTNTTIDIDASSFHRWIRVNRESLELSYNNWWQSQQNINLLAGVGYIQKNNLLKHEEPINCTVEKKNITEIKNEINNLAQNYNGKIESKILEEKKKKKEESKKRMQFNKLN